MDKSVDLALRYKIPNWHRRQCNIKQSRQSILFFKNQFGVPLKISKNLIVSLNIFGIYIMTLTTNHWIHPPWLSTVHSRSNQSIGPGWLARHHLKANCSQTWLRSSVLTLFSFGAVTAIVPLKNGPRDGYTSLSSLRYHPNRRP